MRHYKKYLSTSLLLVLTLSWSSCSDEFLNQTPQDQITLDNFYQSPDQIQASTGVLYGFPWFNYHSGAIYDLGDGMGGNLLSSNGSNLAFVTFAVEPVTPTLITSWKSFYTVVSMSNSIINNMPARAKSAGVSDQEINYGLAEARLMRSLAYFYLVRLWGAVPIVESTEEIALTDANLYRNTVEDVYTFMIKDLEFAEQYGYPAKRSDGRVSMWTAKAMLSKIYLYLEDYPKSLAKAEEVINSGQYALTAKYEDNFRTLKNNGPESILALQWTVDPQFWGVQNTAQAFLAPFGEGITEAGDGWGSFVPSIDLVNAYERGDLRKRQTVMTGGEYYPELVSKANPNGYTYPADKKLSITRANWRKGIVGSPPANGGTDGPVDFMRTALNTNILRLAEVYLIAAEAVMADQATTNPKALEYINKVRQRAGLEPKVSLSFDELLHERRIELAGEAEYWYDLQRMDRAKAIALISQQERGTYGDLIGAPNSLKVVPDQSDFLLPVPQSEVDRSPNLEKEPVPYSFK